MRALGACDSSCCNAPKWIRDAMWQFSYTTDTEILGSPSSVSIAGSDMGLCAKLIPLKEVAWVFKTISLVIPTSWLTVQSNSQASKSYLCLLFQALNWTEKNRLLAASVFSLR